MAFNLLVSKKSNRHSNESFDRMLPGTNELKSSPFLPISIDPCERKSVEQSIEEMTEPDQLEIIYEENEPRISESISMTNLTNPEPIQDEGPRLSVLSSN